MNDELSRVLYRTYARFPWLNARVQFLMACPSGARWLDVGSGTGFVAGQLHALRPDLVLTASDVVDSAAHFAGMPNTRFVRVDEGPWPYGDNSFDMVTSFHVLEHLAEPARRLFLAEMSRVLRPAGRFYLETPSARSFWPPRCIRSRHGITHFRQDPTHVSLVAPLELQEAARKHHWNIQRIGLYRNWLFLALAPVLAPLALAYPWGLAYHYLIPNLVGWSTMCYGTIEKSAPRVAWR